MENCKRLCSLTRKPKLFFICCLFSLLIGGISSFYFYYPENIINTSQTQYPSFHHQLHILQGDDITHNDEPNLIEQPEHKQMVNLIQKIDSFESENDAVPVPELSQNYIQTQQQQHTNQNNIIVQNDIIIKNNNNNNNKNNMSVSNHSKSNSNNNSSSEITVNVLTPSLDLFINTNENNDETKFRHHHSENSIMFIKLNNLIEKSKFTNVIEKRLIHFDLKGAPPKVTFFKEIIKLSQEAGLTGLLIEWEDTFPWKDNLRNLTLIENHYTLSQVQEIIHFAEIHGLEVIPLIQTFGHVEFILKQEEFSHLREMDDDPQSFCPSKNETMDLIQEMILQIVKVHQNSRFIHIGCDEIYNLRICNLCKAASDAKDTLFIEHVTKVATFVRTLGKIPIIWDDMLRTISRPKLSESSLGTLVEPMVWVYAEDIDRFVGWETWEKYASIFPTIWIAGAFKGAFGETLTIPKLTRHAENTQRWIDIVGRESHRWDKGIGGMVLTGWSRYDHFAVLCELLPASIPSLIYSSLISSVPTPGASIRNRVFIIKNETDNIYTSTSTSPSTIVDSIRKRRSIRRWVPHPQSLRIKERAENIAISSFARGSRASSMATIETSGINNNNNHNNNNNNNNNNPFEQRLENIATDFLKILNCPVTLAMTKTLLTAKNSEDDEFSFVSRCNFPGVSFFRTSFRLRSLINEILETISNLNHGRGWVTKYNQRHQYSLPLRVDELIFKDIPRLKRNLVLTSKSVGISMKSLYSKDTILEWLEQHVWDAWQNLEELERVGKELKNIKIWSRRPLKSPDKMTIDLGLQPLNLDNETL